MLVSFSGFIFRKRLKTGFNFDQPLENYMKTVFVTWLSLNTFGTMPRWTERQQAADEIHNTFFAGIIAEIAGQLQEDEDWYDHHPDSSSSSDLSSSP